MLPYEKKINNIRIPEKSIIHYRQYGTYDKFRKVYYHEFVYDENNLSVPLSEHDIWFCKFGIEYDSGQGGLFFRTGYPQKKYEKFNQVPRINIHEYPEVNSNLIGYLEGEVTYKKVYQSAEGTFWPDFGEWYYITTSDGISGYVLANELSEVLIKGQFVEYVDEPFSNEYNDKNKDDNNALINDNDDVEDETLEDNIKNNDENRFSSLDNKVFIGISCIILIIVTILIAFLIKKKK